MGDAKLAGTMGLVLGWAVAPALFIAIVTGCVAGTVVLARRGVAAGRRRFQQHRRGRVDVAGDLGPALVPSRGIEAVERHPAEVVVVEAVTVTEAVPRTLPTSASTTAEPPVVLAGAV